MAGGKRGSAVGCREGVARNRGGEVARVSGGARWKVSLAAQQAPPFVRDPRIPVDAEYGQKIKEYTTEPFFSSPLVDYLPASKTVPTPKALLGDVAGAPGKLPYAEEVYQYMRMLEKAAPGRVKVVSIGRTEEGREMIAVPITSDAIMAKLEAKRVRLAKPADPPTNTMGDAQEEALVAASTPHSYAHRNTHSPDHASPPPPQPAPRSRMGGSSGARATRFAVGTPSALTLPSRICCSAGCRSTTMKEICPAITSSSAGTLPRYGTCRMSIPEAARSISAPRCCGLPLPAEP